MENNLQKYVAEWSRQGTEAATRPREMTCERCRKKFVARHAKTRYCSSSCRVMAWNEKVAPQIGRKSAKQLVRAFGDGEPISARLFNQQKKIAIFSLNYSVNPRDFEVSDIMDIHIFQEGQPGYSEAMRVCAFDFIGITEGDTIDIVEYAEGGYLKETPPKPIFPPVAKILKNKSEIKCHSCKNSLEPNSGKTKCFPDQGEQLTEFFCTKCDYRFVTPREAQRKCDLCDDDAIYRAGYWQACENCTGKCQELSLQTDFVWSRETWLEWLEQHRVQICPRCVAAYGQEIPAAFIPGDVCDTFVHLVKKDSPNRAWCGVTRAIT